MSNGQTLTATTISPLETVHSARRRRDVEGHSDYGTFGPRPVLVSQFSTTSPIFTPPFISPLIFENTASDARDHCANERNFLSWLRLSVYLAILSIAITMSFHLQTPPTKLEAKVALPLGLVFWALALLTLATGLGNYLGTIEKYRKKSAVVQAGWKTQTVGFFYVSRVWGVCGLIVCVCVCGCTDYGGSIGNDIRDVHPVPRQ
ncbi:hypothetical protein DFH27DRAFT_61627 [Peziza echinospora]|nr:hypothetical protein DFH27DRAFT_61627 [Peziza echinospora]